jgi:hypothetical protein
MRSIALALFLCAGTAALCQSPAQTPFNFTWRDQSLPATNSPANPDKLFSDARLKPFASLKVFPRAEKNAAPWSQDAEIDPKVIIHPPQSSIGRLSPGTVIEQKEYANLRMLPIDSPRPNMQAIPAQWPNLKVQAIPTRWPQLEISPVLGTSPLSAQTPEK